MKEFYKVLIVDDEMLIRQGIINYIEWEQEGYKIIGEASNGEEALELLETYQPQIMITDIVMPGMDGIELVKKVKENYPDTEIIVLSSFEDFDYVRQTFQNGVADYILKPKLNTTELIKTLNRVTVRQQKSPTIQTSNSSVHCILKKMIEGYHSHRDMNTIQEQFPYDTFVLVEALWSKKHPPSLSKQQMTTLFKKELKDVIHIDIPVQDEGILFVTNFVTDDLQHVRTAVENCHKAAASSSVKWIIGQPFDSIDQLKEIYETNQKKLQQYHFYLADRKLLAYDQLPAQDDTQPDFDLNHLIYLIKRKQFQEAFIYLNEHIGILSHQYDRDAFEFKSWLENIIFNIIVLLGNMNYSIKELEAEKYSYFSDINDAFHIREAIAVFDAFIAKVENLVLPSNIETTSNIQLLLDYIDDHYEQHLTLKTLADHFHFNPSYLSSYFSKHHQEGFSEYLNHVRIKNAMKLLQTTDLSISAISEEVGYSDPSYFTKVFKKVASVSPSTFRRDNKTMN
ncbi:response regulator transcription factor [Gracilibacillus caseinilyticus]|uniref:Response regulator transcription factor n=1 Tax=Gracilibacillus caseinilyticus TaxID=2932256 RepID=A0ABY4F2I4_9BACI|nr:response regulator transcription factor [Gracilibacillus caseinilyticus]UOQ50084.1 response regulator transcription factor [Gracilibacillus caseinilyticus]